jgi:hypothetical protein
LPELDNIYDKLKSYHNQLSEEYKQLESTLFTADDIKTVLALDVDKKKFEDKTEGILFKALFNKERKITNCKFFPKDCEVLFNAKNKKIGHVRQSIRNLITKYNQSISIIQDLKDFVRLYNTDVESDIVFKFGYDNKGHLICLFCDLKHFFDFMGNSDLYIFYGEYHRNRNKLNMFLKYCGSYQDNVSIIDFLSSRRRRGHGSFALTNLEFVVQKLNERIVAHNSNITDEENKLSIVKRITGSIHPALGAISLEDLVKFYEMHGYIDSKGCLNKSVDLSNIS